MTLRHLRSSTAHKRPTAVGLSDGQLALAYHADSPGLFFKDTAGAVVKVGPVHVGSTAPNVAPAGSSGNSKGESWLDISGANPVLKIWNGSAWALPQPIATGTVITSADSGTVTSAMIANGAIVNDDINANAAIVDSKLATIATANKVSAAAIDIDGATDIGAALADVDLILVDDGGGGTNRKAAVTRITDYAFAKVSGDITISSAGAAAIAAGVIVNADINASAAIADTKLATISTSGKVANSATTATNLNTASAIVARDASGNFSAGTITAALSGNASTATTLQNARTINGVSFNGSANITVTANTGTSLTFNNAGSGGASGSTFNGSSALTVSYNTVGAPSTTGTNASGTWGIGISGNAATATKLSSSRTFALTGDVTGSVGSDLTSGASITTAITAGSIVNADVNASAAIAGTKISPDFGSQAVSTTGSLTAGSGVIDGGGLRITNTGSGDSLLVEDEANPDSTPFVINATGRVINGHTAAINTVNINSNTITPNFQQHATDQGSATIATTNWQDSSTAAYLVLGKSYGGAIGTHAPVVNNATIGFVNFTASDGTTFGSAAWVGVYADALTSAGSTPGRLVFATTSPGATSSTERMRIRSDGNIGIGGSGSSAVRLYNQGVITGGTTAYANYTVNTVQSDVTSALAYRTALGTAAATFTTTLQHYRASQAALGAGSTVNAQYGFFADGSLVGGTSNFGFFSDIPITVDKNCWNFYASDTAPNYFAGNVGIGINSPEVSLEVAKSSAGTGDGPVIRLRDSFSGSFTANATSSSIEFYSQDGNGPGAMVRSRIANTVVDTTGADQALTFWTTGSAAGNTLTRRMTIHSSGHVSIGSATDSGDDLYVNGTLRTESNIIINSTVAQILNGVSTGYTSLSGDTAVNTGANILLYGGSHATVPNRLQLRQGSSVVLSAGPTGNVSLGTSTDTGDGLYVGGSIRSNGQIKTPTGDSDLAPGFTWVTDEDTGMFRVTTDVLGFSAGGQRVFKTDLEGVTYSRRIQFESNAEIDTFAGQLRLDSAANLYLEATDFVRSATIYNSTTASAANMHVSSANAIYRSTSSIKYKYAIEAADLSLSENLIYNSEPVWYRSLCDADPESWSYWGFIAEEVAQLDPRMVHWGGENNDEPESVQYDRYVVHLVNVIQKQKQQLDAIETRLAALEAA